MNVSEDSVIDVAIIEALPDEDDYAGERLLGQILLKQAGLTPEHLEEGLTEQKNDPRKENNRIGEILFVDDTSASTVDDPRALPHLGESLGVDEAVRLGRERRMDRHTCNDESQRTGVDGRVGADPR